jgi:hypothetical protein
LDVHLSKQVIVAAAIAFALLIGVVGFLLGRESRRPRRSAEAAPEIVAEASMTEAAASAAGGSMPRPRPRPSAGPVPAESAEAASQVAGPGAGGGRAAAPVATPALPTTAPAIEADPAIEVRDYFVQMASIQSAGPTGDPMELANKLLASAAGGDSSGFHALIKDVDNGIARAQQVHVPAACQEYHQRVLEMLGESGRMLRTLQSSLARQDTDGLGALAASATSLQSRADALNAQARQIRARYGL